jgi:hypothetical protein
MALARLPRDLQELASDAPQMLDHNLPAIASLFTPQLAGEMLDRARQAREQGNWPAWFTYGVMAAPAAGVDVANALLPGAGVGRFMTGGREAVPAITGALQRTFGTRPLMGAVGAGGAAAAGAEELGDER